MAEHYPKDQTLGAINEFKKWYQCQEDQKKYLIRQFCIDTRRVKAPVRTPRWDGGHYNIQPFDNHYDGSFKGTFDKRFTIEIQWKNYDPWLSSHTLSFVPKDPDGKTSVITGKITEEFLLKPEIATKNPDATPVPKISEFKFINSVLVQGDWLSFIDVYSGFPFYRPPQ